jgi:hypothetical protein
MNKPGKACAQLMEANDTDKTKIKVVRNIFRLTFVFNALKIPLNLYLNSLIALIFIFLFSKLEECLALKHA